MSYDNQNIFAKIIRGEIPCKRVYEDEFALAFHDIQPEAPTHVLVVPKGDFVSFDDFTQKASSEFMVGYFSAVQKTAALIGVVEGGYRIISNHGADASQSVPHFHMHILGGKPLGKLLP
ncbi:MAG: histidine triad nucleotide-binding protein [Alphaproteobacteria bacterium]|nr:histidine triad nucleotide-binding protein [Alphaproteobacteria bacterium]